MSVILAILIAGLAASGWFILNQKEMLDRQSALLEEADGRIKVMEDRLRLTDETLSETGDQTQEKISFWESEIRKLWAVTNDRNKRLIDQNQAGIGKLQKSLAGIEAEIRKQQTQVDRHEQVAARQQQLLDQLTGMELQMQRLVASQNEMIQKFNTQQQGLTTLRNDLSRRLTETEQGITAIDAFRAQISNRLNELERRLPAPVGG